MSKEIDVEQKLREIERKYGGFANFELITLCNGKDKYIADLQSQLAITEKALELACEEIGRIEAKFGSAYIRANGYLLDYFKTKAKEMLENE